MIWNKKKFKKSALVNAFRRSLEGIGFFKFPGKIPGWILQMMGKILDKILSRNFVHNNSSRSSPPGTNPKLEIVVGGF